MQWFNEWWATLTLLQQCLAVVAIPATVILVIQTILLLFGLGGHAADNGDSAADADSNVDIDSDADVDSGTDFDTDTDADIDTDLDTDIDSNGGTGIDIGEHGGACHDGHVFEGDHDAHDGAHHAAGVRLFTLRGIVALFAVGGWVGIAACDLGISDAASVALALVFGIAAMVIAALVIKVSLKLQENGNISVKNAVARTATVYIPIPPSRSGSGKVMMNLQERFVEMTAITDHGVKIATGEAVQVVSVTDKGDLVVRPIK